MGVMYVVWVQFGYSLGVRYVVYYTISDHMCVHQGSLRSACVPRTRQVLWSMLYREKL